MNEFVYIDIDDSRPFYLSDFAPKPYQSFGEEKTMIDRHIEQIYREPGKYIGKGSRILVPYIDKSKIKLEL